MLSDLRPGNALGCPINSHRAGWNGTICRNAASWDCGAKLEFREDHCAHDQARCFHLNTFHKASPQLVVHPSGADWLFHGGADVLNDQLLLIWGREFREPHGIPSGKTPDYHVFGAYRIKEVRRVDVGLAHNWHIVPHEDGWVDLSPLRIARPRFHSMGGPYFKQVEGQTIERVFETAADKIASGIHELEPASFEWLQRFRKSLPGWLDTAASKVAAMIPEVVEDRSPSRPAPAAYQEPGMGHKPLKGLADLVAKSDRAPVAPKDVPAVESPAAAPAVSSDAVQSLISTAHANDIQRRFGAETRNALVLASMSKPLLILRGSPGVGKSYTAVRLNDDPSRERTLIVPVGSTWRGREDLLGYVNPIDDHFTPTEFTRFLLRAQDAWDAGDRKPWVVVFEEFNLSPPEHWLSDLLVRTQYPAEPRADRTLSLGGQAIVGGGASEVYLSPGVRFLATINSDHTTRRLSPRVLDRSAVVTLELLPRAAIEQAEVALEAGQVEAIAELDFRIRASGAAFSFRTALSLRQALESKADLGLDDWSVLDLILAQEVLSKVMLLASDPADRQVLAQLMDWSEGAGAHLPVCGRLIAGWRDELEAGRDVLQA